MRVHPLEGSLVHVKQQDMSGIPLIKDRAYLSPERQNEIRDLANMPDSDINTDDIPETTDWAEARRGLFYRPLKMRPNRGGT